MRLKTKSKPVVTDVPSSGVQAPKMIEKNKNSVPRCLCGVFVIYLRHKNVFPCNLCKDMITFVQAGINDIILTQLFQQERHRVHISCEMSMNVGHVQHRSVQHIIKTWYVLKSTFFLYVFFVLFCLWSPEPDGIWRSDVQGDEISFVFDQCDRDLVCHTVSYVHRRWLL